MVITSQQKELENAVVSLLASRKNCTIYELKEDYEMIVCDGALPSSTNAIRDFLMSIKGVECHRDMNGTEFYSYTSQRTAHISSMVKRQKRRRRAKKRSSSREGGRESKQMRLRQPAPIIKVKFDHQGYLYDHQLIGDDFFLSVAKLDLGYKMYRDEETRVLSISNCVSGMTIRDVSNLLQQTKRHVGEKVIVHVGSVDILNGRDYSEILIDYMDMVKNFKNRGTDPIVCTIPPLANMVNDPKMMETLNKLNNFLRGNTHWKVFDLNKIFIRNNSVVTSLYQPEPRTVSGSDKQHQLWNRVGRQVTLAELTRYLSNFEVGSHC